MSLEKTKKFLEDTKQEQWELPINRRRLLTLFQELETALAESGGGGGGSEDPEGTLYYKALISQNTPVIGNFASWGASYPFPRGMIVTLGSFDGDDDFSTCVETIVSGTINTSGCVFVANGEPAVNWILSVLAYDGAPYVVSTNSDDEIAPFVNTLGGTPVYSRNSVGQYRITLAGAFVTGKVTILIGNEVSVSFSNDETNIVIPIAVTMEDDDRIEIRTILFNTGYTDEALYYTTLNITVTP